MKMTKDISRSTVSQKIKYDQYKDVIFQSTITREIQYRIQSERYIIYTIYRQNKVSLLPLHNKRYDTKKYAQNEKICSRAL